MFCVTCGKQIGDQSKFCPYCGGDVRHGEDIPPQQVAGNAIVKENAETPDIDQLKTSRRAILITIIIATVCVLVFLMYIGPKFLGTQFLPIDPFGLMSENDETDSVAEQDESGSSDTGSSEDMAVAPNYESADPDGDSEASVADKTPPSANASDSADVQDAAPVEPLQNGSDDQEYFVFFDSDKRFLEETDLAGLSAWELFVGRNEIFARHGRGFVNEELRSHFADQPWYTELYTSQEFDAMASPLNEYEKENAKFILNYEQEIESPYL